MLDCKRQRGPCSEKPAPPPPPCPPPPKPPFNWNYVWPWMLFFSLMGAIYRFYLWKEERDRLSQDKPIWRPRPKVKRPFNEEDLPVCVQYLIIGTGPAGWSAYEAIMANHATAKVFFVSTEDCIPYDRTPLGREMWLNRFPPDINNLNYVIDGKRTTMYKAACKSFMDPVKFFRKETGPAVSIAAGWCVLRVDAEEHCAYIKTRCGEQPIYYQRCLLAPGSKPKNLGAFKTAPKELRDKVTTLRTIRDLEIAFRRVKESKHVVVVGGGALGSELSYYLAKMNQKVKEDDPEAKLPEFVQIIKSKGILASVLPQYLGEWAAEKIKCEGIKMITNAEVIDAFLTKDKRLQLTLSNGSSVVTDYAFVAIGIDPRVDIAQRSNLEIDTVNGGFLVNTELEARKHLFVAGDAASIYTEWKDSRIRFQHLSNAKDTGTIAGINMTGEWNVMNLEPHSKLELGEHINLEVVGEVGACMPTVGVFKQCDHVEDPPPPKSSGASGDRPCYKKTSEYKNRYKRGLIFYLRDEYVVGIACWNVPPVDDRKGVITEMLRTQPTYNDINLLAELLGFPETQCVYIPPEHVEEKICITRLKKW